MLMSHVRAKHVHKYRDYKNIKIPQFEIPVVDRKYDGEEI